MLGSLSAIGAVNFFVLLPVLSPGFVHILPYAVTLTSKLAFGLVAGGVMRFEALSASLITRITHRPARMMPITRRDSRAPCFPIVCVGGSAGGLDAYTRLLHHLPETMGVAIVIVNHLRTVPTLLHEILPRHSSMPVALITDGMPVTQNRVFIIPEKRDLHVDAGVFRLKPISKPHGWPDVITVCLTSLTRHWAGQLIAVIVSGYDGDGAAALCGIRAVGGITIAQKPDTADIPDMPKSAIASGCIDYVLSPESIAATIVRIAQQPS